MLKTTTCGNETFSSKLRTTPSFHENKSVGDSVIYIRTVFHVLQSDVEQVSQTEVNSLLEQVNTLFRAQEVDYSLIHPQHHDKVQDTKIQFCLADTDPLGLSHDGINFFDAGSISFEQVDVLVEECIEAVKQNDLGGVNAWPVEQYLNIWLAPMVADDYSYSYGVAYEDHYPVGGLTNCIPGAVVDFTDLDAGLIAHELGHVLGLHHTWYIPPGTTGSDFFCDGTDYMDDTPVCWPTNECGEENTCEENPDEMDNVTNIMNYACRQMFTPDQASTMYNNLVAFSSDLLVTEPLCGDLVSSLDIDDGKDFNILIGPNPNDGNFTINFGSLGNDVKSISIVNPLGNIVHREPISSNGFESFEVNAGIEKSGIYFLIIEGKSKQRINKKIVIL